MVIFQLPSLIVLLALFLLTLFVVKKTTTSSKNGKKIPGPWKLPLIGSLHHLIGAGLPHRALARLAGDHGPVMLLKAGQVDLVVLTSKEGAEEIMKVQDASFASRPQITASIIVAYGGTGIAFSPYGPYWRQLRKICVMELLSTSRVKSFASTRMQEVHAVVKELVAAAATGSTTPVNLSEKIMALGNSIVCRATFGKKMAQQKRFMGLMKETVEVASGFNMSDLFPSIKFLDVKYMKRLRRMHRDIDEILDGIITERRRQKDERSHEEKGEEVEDLVDVLLKAKELSDEVPISFDNIKAVILDMFNGGTETSSMTIEWAMSELIKNPTKMMKAQEEVRNLMKGRTHIDENDVANLQYLKLVIKETLRLHPPVPLLLPRVSKETHQVLGYEIPAGTKVIINGWSLARDPLYWGANAESFQPERFVDGNVDYKGSNFEFLAFGAGRRICPGMSFGLAGIELALANLLFHFDWDLPNGLKPEDLDMTEAFGASAVRKESLRLIPTVRIPVAKVE